ncbi:hypothetical protein ACH4GK_21235 [Streptomyces rimosus]|uniref:hypothetical protein n=1 Tax=Streptomyces rimosus TaxID=1927 RepID=UPI00131AD4D7|nr:hypothetical protein [Streptomyces rimosus]
MIETFKYRHRAKAAGLAADISAHLEVPHDSPDGVRVHRKVFLSTTPNTFYWLDFCWMAFGVSLHSENLASLHPSGITVKVTSLTFPLSDYRPEVAALAMDGWIRRNFDFPDAGVGASYDPSSSTYHFHWGAAREPFIE